MSSSLANEVEVIGNDAQGSGGRKEEVGYMRENGGESV